ncbi:MAG: hypothetical protein M1587_06780 [Thaumarchaeota archaeon]|nr:hypothetical protein [Nitrososphaerota archaeon]
MKGLDEILRRLRNGDKVAVQEFLKENAKYILSFPKYRRKEHIIEGGEFYFYTAKMLEDGKRLLSFDETRGSFEVWFTAVLENFLNTLVKKRLTEKSRLDIKYGDIEEIAISDVSEDELFEFERQDKTLRTFFDDLNDTERAVAVLLSLFYREVVPEDLKLLSTFAGNDPPMVAQRLQDLLTGELSDEYQRIRSESKKVAALQSNIEVLDSKLEEEQFRLQAELECAPRNQAKISELQSLVEKLEAASWKKRTKYHLLCQAQRRRQDLVLLRNKTLSQFLNMPLGTVTSTVTRLRQRFIEVVKGAQGFQ